MIRQQARGGGGGELEIQHRLVGAWASRAMEISSSVCSKFLNLFKSID